MELKTSVIAVVVTLLNDPEVKTGTFKVTFHKVPEDTKRYLLLTYVLLVTNVENTFGPTVQFA